MAAMNSERRVSPSTFGKLRYQRLKRSKKCSQRLFLVVSFRLGMLIAKGCPGSSNAFTRGFYEVFVRIRFSVHLRAAASGVTNLLLTVN